MPRRLLCKLLLVLILALPSAGQAQQDSLQQQKTRAYNLFHQGKAKQSAEILKSLVSTQSTASEQASLLSDLLEVCATAYDWTCVGQAIQDVLRIMKSEPALNDLYPRIILYEIRLMCWLRNDTYMEDLIRRGGAASVVSLYKEPSIYAEISLQIAIFHIRKNDVRGAELNISQATLALLLTDAHKTYDTSKIIILLMDVLIAKQDLGGAADLFLVTEGFLQRNLVPGSILQSTYRRIIADLYSYTNFYEEIRQKIS